MVHTLQIGSVDSEVLWMSLIGFGLVTLLLVLLVFVVHLFGVIFAKAKGAQGASKSAPASTETPTNEEIAAIAVALRLHTLARHDKESGVLTFSSQSSNSAWSSKVHGLRQMPRRK